MARSQSPWRSLEIKPLVIEVNTIGCLVLDAIPERLELGAFQDSLPRFHDDALVGVLDVEFPRHLLQHIPYRRKMPFQRFRQSECPVLERSAQRALHPTLGIDESLRLQVFEDGGGFIEVTCLK